MAPLTDGKADRELVQFQPPSLGFANGFKGSSGVSLMGLRTKASSGGQDFEIIPAGQYVAICVAVIDLGTHTESFQGNDPEDVHKLLVVWELPGETGNPCIGMDFRVSLHPKSKLRQTLKSWRSGRDLNDGEEFDPSVMLGKPCQLTVENKTSGDNKYHKVTSVTGLAKGMAVPEAVNKGFVWDMDVQGAGGKPPSLPDWVPFLYGKSIEEWISTSHERAGKPQGNGQQANAGQQPQQANGGQAANPGQHTTRSATPAQAADASLPVNVTAGSEIPW
jgi:hypothetical protein